MEPYARIAALYDAEFAEATVDVAYFRRHGVGGPVLVLGCGTGRVCRGLEADRPVVGLDRSPAMLERARAYGGLTRYVRGDMTAFDLGPFAEIIVPNASFSFLPDRRAQAACLAACARALAPGAPLTIDVPMPDFTRLGEPTTAEKPAWEGRIDGRVARRTRRVERRPHLQRLELYDRYFLDDVEVATSHLPLRLIFPAEAEWMLEACGFYVDALHGDYADSPLRSTGPRLIVRAIRQ